MTTKANFPFTGDFENILLFSIVLSSAHGILTSKNTALLSDVRVHSILGEKVLWLHTNH